MILNKLSSTFLGRLLLPVCLVLLLALMGTLLAVRLVGVASGDSHVITEPYYEVEPDGYWTGEVGVGGHQVWTFELKKPRHHNMRIIILEGTSLSVSVDGDELGTVTNQGDFTVWLKPRSHELKVDNTGGTTVKYDLYMGAPATITVDTADDNAAANDGKCTLREAINNANANSDTTMGDCDAGVSTDTIDFIGNLNISPTSALPAIIDPVIIDGTSFTVSLLGNSIPAAAGANGLVIGNAGQGSTIKGLVIKFFARGGVLINDSPDNIIGGTTVAARNVISRNQTGVIIKSAASTGNVVEGNFIGTNTAGNAPDRNFASGVNISGGATNNLVGGGTGTAPGGACTGPCNVISGNTSRGVLITGITTTGNKVRGNFIGTDVAGTAAVGNNIGVEIRVAPFNTIGGKTAGERNVISDNVTDGVVILGGIATDNVVEGNFIGTDTTGTVDLGNVLSGVLIVTARNNTIGGPTPAERNVISANDSHGVRILNTASGNKVHGNFIGTDAAGGMLGNTGAGVLIENGSGNTIGTTTAGEGNTIAFNTLNGVRVTGANSINNPVRGNSIHDNGGLGIDNLSGGNTELNPPTVKSAGSAEGKACKNCMVDVFSDADGEGAVYEGSTMASGGSGAWSFPGPVTGPFVTATATDASGNTSEFSTAPFEICTSLWPSTTVNTIAKGQSSNNNMKVSHAITGNIVDAGAVGAKDSRIRICEGTAVSIVVTDTSGGAPGCTAATADDVTFGTTTCTITYNSLTGTEKYIAVSSDGTDTDRVTLLAGIDY